MIVCIIKAYLVTREVFGGLFLLPQSLASTMIEWIVNSQSLGFPRLLRFLGPQKQTLFSVTIMSGFLLQKGTRK